MFKYESRYLHPVKVDKPNPNYATLLQEQLGGPQGELKAAMQYFAQSFRIRDKEIRDLFLDIATEELCHLEMIAELINQLNGHEPCANKATIGNVEAIRLAVEYGAPIQYDREAQSPYFTYRNQGREQEVWFEDVRSIAAKIELAKEYELYGVGYWNLMRPFRANWIMLE